MTEQELIERIDRLSGQLIVNMSNESLKMLTSDFKESLVRRVVAVAPSLRDQGLILDKLEETINEYNRCYYEYDLAWLNSANEAIQNIRFDLECGITIKVESEQNDFQNNMDDSAEFTPITVEEFEKILSETEDSTTNENNTEVSEDIEARITELKNKNEALSKENEAIKQQCESQRIKIEEMERERVSLSNKLDQLNSNSEKEETVTENKEIEWIGCFDGFLHPSLNPQAIANALHNISHSYFPKNERAYWWVFYTVLTEIHWIPTRNYKLALQWVNLHFNCGWDWRKDHQFRFSDINDKIKAAPSSKWNKALTGNVIGDYYGELAKTMRDTFVFIVNGGKLRDNDKFIIPGSPLINKGH